MNESTATRRLHGKIYLRLVKPKLEESKQDLPPSEPEKHELHKPSRFLSADEVVAFLNLKNRASLRNMCASPDGPPYVLITANNRVFDLEDLKAWAETRKVNKVNKKGGNHD